MLQYSCFFFHNNSSCLPTDVLNETGVQVKIKHDSAVHHGYCTPECQVGRETKTEKLIRVPMHNLLKYYPITYLTVPFMMLY